MGACSHDDDMDRYHQAIEEDMIAGRPARPRVPAIPMPSEIKDHYLRGREQATEKEKPCD